MANARGSSNAKSEREKMEFVTWAQETQKEFESQTLLAPWSIGYVAGEVSFHDTVALIHNLALEWRRRCIVPPDETPDERQAREKSAAEYETSYQDLQRRFIKTIPTVEKATEILNKTIPAGTSPTTASAIQKRKDKLEKEMSRLAGLIDKASAIPESAREVKTLEELPEPRDYYKDKSHADQKQFWLERWTLDVALSWYAEWLDLIDIAGMFKAQNQVAARFMAGRWAETADAVYFYVAGRRHERMERILSSPEVVFPWKEYPNMVGKAFHDYSAKETTMGGLENVLVHPMEELDVGKEEKRGASEAKEAKPTRVPPRKAAFKAGRRR